jgi:hypothetical protein
LAKEQVSLLIGIHSKVKPPVAVRTHSNRVFDCVRTTSSKRQHMVYLKVWLPYR